MAPALGAAAPQTGAGYVCLDAGPLIAFNDTKRLDWLSDWFPVAYAPEAVVVLELNKRPKQNNPTTSAPWLYWVRPHPDDAQLVADMLRRFGKGPPENQGEAEVVAACKRYGWTAVLDDEQGRGAADDHGVAHVYVVTLAAMAAAYDKLTPTKAWQLHVAMQQRARFSPLKPDPSNKPVFVDFCGKLRLLRQRRGDPDWPLLLAAPGLDDLLLSLIHKFNRTP